MQRATCPECGSTIGGGHHQLQGDNTRDTELENLNLGAQPDPFRWVENNGRAPWERR